MNTGTSSSPTENITAPGLRTQLSPHPGHIWGTGRDCPVISKFKVLSTRILFLAMLLVARPESEMTHCQDINCKAKLLACQLLIVNFFFSRILTECQCYDIFQLPFQPGIMGLLPISKMKTKVWRVTPALQSGQCTPPQCLSSLKAHRTP